MAEEHGALRSRRAILAAAAGSAAALAATAALPLAASAADPNDVVAGADNPTTATTSVSNATTDSIGLGGNATGTGYGVQATSTGGAGLLAWSISGPPGLDPANVSYTGAYGWAPTSSDPTFVGVGVWGDSDDFGVYGTGSVGVYGYGGNGVFGESAGTGAAVVALASAASNLALDVHGKVKFSRSGRGSIAKNKSSLKVTLAGVSTSSLVFAVLFSNRSGRYVRAVVPTSGSFTIYLNTTVTSTTLVSWFVLN